MRNLFRTWQRSRLGRSATRDLFSPTAGRWLWNEPRQRQEHTQTFDLKALEDVIIKAAGSALDPAFVRLEKLAEGASNKVFLAVVGKQRLIVKIPDPVVPPRLVTASEAATLEFLRSELDLPVPKVFAWSDSSDNPVGCEYILMEEAQGRPLNAIWPSLDIPDKLAVVDEVLSIQKRLIAASNVFDGYGSLYFADDVAKLGISHHLPVSSAGGRKYCIGPLANQHFVEPVLMASGVDCGPWRSSQDYLTSIARSSMAQIVTSKDQDTTASRAFSFPVNTASDTSATAVCNMLQTLCTVMPYILPRTVKQNQPVLWHKDLHFGNLFVSALGKVSCIVDWQGTDILPLFLAARIPQFIQLEDDALLLELPEDFSIMPSATKLRIWERYRQSMLQQYYLADLRESAPELAALLEDRHLAPIRKQVELFGRVRPGQDTDALFLRETLLRIQRHWPDFFFEEGISPQCPIKIAGDELINHQRDGRRYNEFQDLLKACNIPVAEEGWVPADQFAERHNDLTIAIRKTIESLESQAERLEFENRLYHWNLTDCPAT
ncbi:hypothetical protein AYO20_03235 [Fonsecaea nubica]|uniref:Altered inheritance of mitochondria protein 9, mitochondrial n=1 Tax=Fonsecaea nubica TaxID=856822 RepID=A0A178D6J5_9EURO|nr:hypothetical protein AYO20_03235 [Fonsecaea nubica]OAL37386.1 hypothetical protein AYO20_03235 [Fonsecaea nubica]